MLLGDGEPLPAHAPLPQLPVFGTEAQQTRFLELAQARLAEILRQLDRPTHSLEEDDAFSPEVLDTRGAVLMMSAEEQAEIGDEPIPSLAQVWALGFMFAVENWEADWALPRDKEAAQMIDNALEQIVALTEDDTGKPAHNLYDENGPASTSQPRIDAFGHAIWASTTCAKPGAAWARSKKRLSKACNRAATTRAPVAAVKNTKNAAGRNP